MNPIAYLDHATLATRLKLWTVVCPTVGALLAYVIASAS